MGDRKEREASGLPADDLDEELNRIRDAFLEEMSAAKQAAQEQPEGEPPAGAQEAPPIQAELEYWPESAPPAQKHKVRGSAVALAVIVILVALVGAADFVIGVPSFASVLQAEQFVKDKKLHSALDAYYDASQNASAAAARRTVLGQARLYRDMGYVENAQSLIQQYYTTDDLEKFPNRALGELAQELDAVTDTISAVEEVFSEYSDLEDGDLPYAELIGKIDALSGQTDASYDKAILEYYKYMLASMTEQEGAVRIGFLQAIEKQNPGYSWLYLPAMASEYLLEKDYDKVLDVCGRMREINVEDASPYGTEASVYRLQKQYDKALDTAEKGIALDDTSSEPYRQKAIVLLLQGDQEGALENAQSAYDLALNYATSYTLALCYLVNDNQDGYDEVVSTLEYYGVEMGQKVLDYQAGKLTVEDIFLSGEGDIA